MNKNKNSSNDYIFRERFLVWLMWLIPIACTGWISIVAWTVVQIMMYNSQVEEQKVREEKKRKMNEPYKVTPKMREINMNLTEAEKELRDKVMGGRCFMKTEEGWWTYVEDKDQWV